jgi:hypothetical protein
VALCSAADCGGGVHGSQGGAVLDCTISNNAAASSGGGVNLDGAGCVVLCTVVSNSASSGGGVCCNMGGAATNCLIVGNRADGGQGGGVALWEAGRLVLSTVTGNEDGAGGVYAKDEVVIDSTVIYGNSPNWYTEEGMGSPVFRYCCTTPTNGLPDGTGCITNAPEFSNPATGDYRLTAGSPCIDAGNNAAGYVCDLAGTPRPLDGDAGGTATVDIGAYEYLNRTADSDGDQMQDGYEHDYDLNPVDPADALLNPDGDVHENRQEFVAGTDPNRADSCLEVVQVSNGVDVAVYFSSCTARQYRLLYCTNLLSGCWTNLPGCVPVKGKGGVDMLSDSNGVPVRRFYRVGVSVP